MWSLAGGNFEERGALCLCAIGLVCMHSQTSILPSEGFFYLQISERFLSGVSHFSGGQSGERPLPTGALQEQPGWRHRPQCPAPAAAASIAPCRAQTWGRCLPRWDSACSRGTSTVRTQERRRVVFVGVALGNPRAKQVMPVKVRLGGAGVPAASPAVLVRDHTFAIASQSRAPVMGHESCYNLVHFTFPGLAFPRHQLARYRCHLSVSRADCPAGFMPTWRAPATLQRLSHHCCCWYEPHAVVPALCNLGYSRAQRCWCPRCAQAPPTTFLEHQQGCTTAGPSGDPAGW